MPWPLIIWRALWWIPAQTFRWLFILCALIGWGPFVAKVVKENTE